MALVTLLDGSSTFLSYRSPAFRLSDTEANTLIITDTFPVSEDFGKVKFTLSGGNLTDLVLTDLTGHVFATYSGGTTPLASLLSALNGALNDDQSYAAAVMVLGGDDTIIGSTESDQFIETGAGNDVVKAGAGDDLIYKWLAGNLTVNGGAGTDTLLFQAEIGNVYPTAFTQQLIVNLTTGVGQNPYGGTLSLKNVENIVGTSQADIITGDAADNIIGDGRFDVGADTINARGGDDTVRIAPFATGIRANGGAGTDTLVFQIDQLGNTLDLINQANNSGIFAGSLFTNFEHYETGGDFSSAFASYNFNLSNRGESLLVRAGILNIAMNGGDDVLTVASSFHGQPVIAKGGAGTDTLIFNQAFGTNILDLANQANNTGVFAMGTYTGFEIFQTLIMQDSNGNPFGSGVLNFRGAGHADQVLAGLGADTLFGAGGADNLAGNDGNDVLKGGAGADVLRGGAGDDLLVGGLGADRLVGAAGNDTVSYSGSSAGVQVNLSGGSGVGGDAQDDTFAGIENIAGSAHNDVLTGNGGANWLFGDRGNDTLTSLGGDDMLKGAGGTDKLIGGAGDDTLLGGGGIDTLLGGNGNDLLVGGPGGDSIFGGTGDDTVSYAASSTGVTVNLAAGTGLGGDAAGDHLAAVENVIGSNHDDRLTGDSGANLLDGGSGNDTLVGGAGSDVLRGGPGSDIFVYNDVSDSAPTPALRDVIGYFAHGHDQIDLSAIDAGSSDGSFTFIGTAGFSHTAGELRYFINGAGHTIVEASTGTGAVHDFQIETLNSVVLTADDFIL